MPNEINIYTPRYLAEVVRSAPPVHTFFRDKFFTNVKPFATKRVDIDIVKGDRRMMLDCSAIAKGYGCDVVARMLKKKGVNNYMVEIGGEVATAGVNDQREPWHIGVNAPSPSGDGDSGKLQAVLKLKDKALATSGNYRNFYYMGGKKYAHTIDPKTGYPVQHNILSATVVDLKLNYKHIKQSNI